MVTVFDTANGLAFAEFELASQNQKLVRLHELVAYEGSELTETTLGVGVYSHRFTTQQPDLVDRTLKAVMATGTPRIRFRVGYGTPDAISWQPWQDNLITFYSGLLMGAGDRSGHSLELHTANLLFAASRSSKTAVRKGTISGIVGRIAQENGFQAVIEATQGEFTYIQSFEDDITFITSKLLPRALSTKGRGSYLFFMQDNVLHFHSLDYQAEVKDLSYFETPYMRLAQVDSSQQLWAAGVAGTRLVVYDPYTAEAREFTSQPGKAIRLANGIYDLASVPSGERNVFYTLSQNRPEEAVALAQNAYEHARLRTFELVATFTRLTNLRVSDIIRLVIAPTMEKSSSWSGYYLLTKTIVTVDRGAITTTCQFNRGEITHSDGNTVADVTGLQASSTQAPGVDLNVRETQDSGQTKGVGKQTSTKVYTAVVDVNSVSS